MDENVDGMQFQIEGLLQYVFDLLLDLGKDLRDLHAEIKADIDSDLIALLPLAAAMILSPLYFCPEAIASCEISIPP